MEIQALSNTFAVRRLGAADVEPVYALSRENRLYYQYHPPFVTRESIREDMEALPEGKTAEDKYYVGFFKEERLVAVMDLILAYPAEETAFIGLFMMHMAYQGRGIGSGIIRECKACLRALGYRKLRLGVDRGNPQSSAFWRKNGFTPVGEGRYLCMETEL